MVARLGRAIDSLVGIFSPARQLRREVAREAARQYAAAKTTRLTGSWSPVTSSVNSIIASSSSTIKTRVRQLVRDFPYFARACDVLTDFTVGTGMQFQARVKDASGKLNKPLNQQIEDAWDWWCEEADVSGKSHLYDLMSLAKRQDVESGEFLLVKVRATGKNRFLPFALQMYEPDWLTTQNDTSVHSGIGSYSDKGTQIYQGVEFDTFTGIVKAYHFMDPDGLSRQVKRIPAEDVIHGYKLLRPGQIRGMSVFAPAVLVAHDLSDYMDAEIDTAKMAAKWLAFIETPDPVAFQGLRATTNAANTSQMIEELENAIIEYLRPGEKVNFAAPNRPGDSFEPFTRLILRMVAISTGISYELLSGDYSGLNYTVLRGIRNDLEVMFAPLQKRHERQFCRPIYREFLTWAGMTGKISLPSDFNVNPYPYLRSQWIPPGMPAVDPLKEGKSNADAINARLRSPQEITAARGRDYEEVLDEIEAAQAMQRERGIEIANVNTGIHSNPATITEDSDEDDQEDAATQPKRGALIPLRA